MPARRASSLQGPTLFRFLGETHDLEDCGWDPPALEKLWRYNLHYFDDLNALHARDRTEWHRALMERWIEENPPGKGSGWEPYPTSIRIVNWVKYFLNGAELKPEAMLSLAVQTRWLAQRLEVHLLGNHLFTNAKALVFAGILFQGQEAEAWMNKGLRILKKQVPEQILPDGGHFERSTMYHALTFEDMLDICNLVNAFPDSIPFDWRDEVNGWWARIVPMRRWLAAMSHPDGEISFFNDAAMGIAPFPGELNAYAERLGFMSQPELSESVTHLSNSGYIRLKKGPAVMLLDVAPVGPDYLPGHAHADTLSFEFSLFGKRVLVNSGTSEYGNGTNRQKQRGTMAHNTLTIDGENSSEVWGGFRVARRAYPFDLNINKTDSTLKIHCAHNGYKRLAGSPVHHREWRLSDSRLMVCDTIQGGFQRAVTRIHLHPSIGISVGSSPGEGILRLENGVPVMWRIRDAKVRIVPSTYHPEFGCSIPNVCIEADILNNTSIMEFSW
jgi:uncharacterized heparinase superfamily protein